MPSAQNVSLMESLWLQGLHVQGFASGSARRRSVISKDGVRLAEPLVSAVA